MTTIKHAPQPTGPLWGLFDTESNCWMYWDEVENAPLLIALTDQDPAILEAFRLQPETGPSIIVAEIPDPRSGPAWIVDSDGVRDYTFPEEQA